MIYIEPYDLVEINALMCLDLKKKPDLNINDGVIYLIDWVNDTDMVLSYEQAVVRIDIMCKRRNLNASEYVYKWYKSKIKERDEKQSNTPDGVKW
jgi:hypothetical protein